MGQWKRIAPLVALLAVQSASAAEVVAAVEDNTAGKVFGGATGLLVGGALAGGPAGAVVGGLVGLFGGAFVQDRTGLSEQAYQVKTAEGDTLEVRAPGETFAPGEQVRVSGNRLHRN